jgi:hypothetical protein
MPNVDRTEMPELAALVERYAMRYEHRLDGSSLWEGRGCEMPMGHIDAMEQIATHETSRAWCDRMRRYPALEIPDEWEPLRISEISWKARCCYYSNHSYRALLAVNDTDVFIIHHPTEAGYLWELNRIETALQRTEWIVRPRELLTGFNWVLAHRRNQMKLDGYWL